MASTFFGLEIASSGLRASNAALNTTANNISNTNTEGYSRQEVKQEAMNPLRVFATYGCAGAGVNTLAIERIREQFYDNKFRDNETKLGEFDTKAYYCKMIRIIWRMTIRPDSSQSSISLRWRCRRLRRTPAVNLTRGRLSLRQRA